MRPTQDDEASPLSVVATALSESGSASRCFSRGPQGLFFDVSNLWCDVGGIGALLLTEEPLNIPPLELFTCGCVYCVHFFSHCV